MLGNIRKAQPRRLIVTFLCLFIACACVLLISPVSHATDSSNADEIVCVTDTGSKYHRPGCGYLRSRNDITLERAVANGYSPCSRCNPPRPNFEYTVIDRSQDKEENEKEEDPPSSKPKNSHSSEANSYKPSAESSSVASSTHKSTLPVNSARRPKKSSIVADVLAFLPGLAIYASFFAVPLILKHQRRRRQRQRCQYYADLLRPQLLALQKRYAQLSELYSSRTFIPLDEPGYVPEGVTIDSSGLPHKIIDNWWQTEDLYEFYRSSANGQRYHRISCRYAKKKYPINAIDIQSNDCSCTPCKVCMPTLPDTKWFSYYTVLSNDQYLLMQMFEKEPGPSA